MILLDTNIFSELMHAEPNPKVRAWLDKQPFSSIWTSSITVFEVRFGIETRATGRRRSLLASQFELVLDDLEQRIATFDTAAAHRTAELMARRRQSGTPGDLRDSMIAGIAIAQGATLATRNVKHFSDLTIPVINPWE
jgi:predicted nucleic acid-binding protein